MDQTTAPRRHAFSVDVEDWRHAASSGQPQPRDGRVEGNTLRLMELLASVGGRATFFFLGEVAERFPGLVRRAVEAGHEIASHGYHHRPLGHLLREEFRRDVRRSVRLLEDISGQRVWGYRAPCFSIKTDVRWPIEILGEVGLAYDSSILPIDRPPGLELVCPRMPFRHDNGVWEVPVGVFRFLSFWHLPLASGGGLRLIPPTLWWPSLRRFERDVGSGIFYIHPWEIDPQPPAGGGARACLLRAGRRRLQQRLDVLLRARTFLPIRETFPQLRAGAAEVPGGGPW